MIAVGIDPGDKVSAFVLIDTHVSRPLEKGIITNEQMRARLLDWGNCKAMGDAAPDVVLIEQITCYGKPVGKSVLDTVFWSGRFAEAWGDFKPDKHLIPRRRVKEKLTGNSKNGDPQVRAALIKRYGGTNDKAVGKKKTPGPLYGVKDHEWQALAVAVCYIESQPYQ